MIRLCHFLILLLILPIVTAHSSLGDPLPYSTYACKGDTTWCKTPCPPLSLRGKAPARNSPEDPAATWARGDKVTITWHKNNHRGGFYRRSLVPVKHMFDHDWHKKTAFDWGCWSQGSFICGKDTPLCGGDKKGKAYRNTITIPGVFPDGDYVFAQVWFGGLHWQGKAPKYADYWSCAFVKIQGGKKVDSYTPKFRPSANPRRGVPKGKCETGSVRPLECGGEACENGPVKHTLPEEFLGGGLPPAVKWALFGKGELKKSKMKESPSTMTEKAVQADKKDKKADATAVKEEEKMVKEKKSTEIENPIEKLIVSRNSKTVGEVDPNEKKTINVGATWAMLEADLGDVRPKRVWIKVPGVGRRSGQLHPYRYFVKKLPMNKWTKITVEAIMPDGKKHSATFDVYFKSGRARELKTKDDSKCAKEKVPPRPTGTWGRRYSSLWWKQREVMLIRRRYCRECPNVC